MIKSNEFDIYLTQVFSSCLLDPKPNFILPVSSWESKSRTRREKAKCFYQFAIQGKRVKISWEKRLKTGTNRTKVCTWLFDIWYAQSSSAHKQRIAKGASDQARNKAETVNDVTNHPAINRIQFLLTKQARSNTRRYERLQWQSRGR